MAEQTIFTNLCMIREGDRVVVMERLKQVWPGIVFPGRHVETGESFTDLVIREVKEETGLTIFSLNFVESKAGMKMINGTWFIFRTSDFPEEVAYFLFERVGLAKIQAEAKDLIQFCF